MSSKLGLGQLLNRRMRSFAGFTWLQEKMDSIESSNSVQTEIRATATLYMVRLIFPFFAVSFLDGLSRISTRAYLVGTLAGALTANFLLLSLSENLLTITGVEDLLAWGIIWPLLLFVMLLAIPFIFLHFRESDSQAEEQEAV